MTAISLTSFDKKGNAYARVCAWTLYISYVRGACERYEYSYDNNGRAAVGIARATIFDALSQIWETIRERASKIRVHRPEADKNTVFRIALVEGGGISNFVAAPGRVTLVSALMAIFWFWSEEEGWSDSTTKECFESTIPVPAKGIDLWGEGATPKILAHLWHWGAVDSSQGPDFQLAALLNAVVRRAIRKPGLPSPYYSYEDVVRHHMRLILTAVPDRLEREDFTYTSFVSEGLLHLLVRTNLKVTCKTLWPDYSRVMNVEFVPESKWHFCLVKNETGKTVTTQFEPTKSWDELKDDARVIVCSSVPPTFLEDRYLLILFCIVFPHRFTSELIRYLGYQFNDVWFIDPPVSA